MKDLIIIFLFVSFLIISPAFGELKDVPPEHWGSNAVNDLVSRGITQGYPDGTFRGDKYINRYEMAMFLSLLYKNAYHNVAVSDKLVEELKVEVKNLNDSLDQLNSAPKSVVKINSDLTLRARSGTVKNLEGSAGKADYRFSSVLESEFGSDFHVKLTLDTLDSSSGSNPRKLFTEMVNIEGRTVIAPFGFAGDLVALTGPGQLIHREGGNYFSADDFTVLELPYNSLSYSTRFRGNYFSLSYVARSQDDFGQPFSNGIEATLVLPKYTIPFLNEVTLTFTPRYIFSDSLPPSAESKDLRGELGISIKPAPKLEWKMLFGAGGGKATKDRYYTNIGFSFNDYFDTGTYFSLSASEVGKKYRIEGLDKHEFGLINSFDRLILDGTADLAMKIEQEITDWAKIYYKGDATLDSDLKYGEDYEGTSIALEAGVIFYIPSGMELDVFNRSYEVPSGVADFTDPGFARIAPICSSITGISLSYNF